MRSGHPQQLRWNRRAHSQHGPPVSLPDIVPVCETATVYVNGLSSLSAKYEPVVPTIGPHLVVRETAFYVRETAGQRFRDHGLSGTRHGDRYNHVLTSCHRFRIERSRCARATLNSYAGIVELIVNTVHP